MLRSVGDDVGAGWPRSELRMEGFLPQSRARMRGNWEGRGGSVGSQLGFGEEEKVNGELARRGFESKARLGSCGGKSGAT